MAEHFDVGAGETRAVDDAGVVEFVGDDPVAFAENGADGASVRGESGLEDDTGFDVLEAGDLLFEFQMKLHGAGDGADRARADAVLARGFDSSFFELRVVAESEVIVGGEIDHALAVEGADGVLLVLEFAEAEESAFGLEFVELLGEERGLRTRGLGRHNR